MYTLHLTLPSIERIEGKRKEKTEHVFHKNDIFVNIPPSVIVFGKLNINLRDANIKNFLYNRNQFVIQQK